MPAVIGAIRSLKLTAMLVDDEVHPLRGFVISLQALLALALAEANIVLAAQKNRILLPALIEPHFVARLIHQNQRRFLLRHRQRAMSANESGRLRIMLPHPRLVFAIG